MEKEIRQAILELEQFIESSGIEALRRIKEPSCYSHTSFNESYDKGWVSGYRSCLGYLQREIDRISKEPQQ